MQLLQPLSVLIREGEHFAVFGHDRRQGNKVDLSLTVGGDDEAENVGNRYDVRYFCSLMLFRVREALLSGIGLEKFCERDFFTKTKNDNDKCLLVCIYMHTIFMVIQDENNVIEPKDFRLALKHCF